MNVHVTHLGADSATVRCVTEYDGVNPPDVFEFVVSRRTRHEMQDRRFILEVRAGTSIDFDNEENEGEELAELRDCWNATRGCLESIDADFDPERL